MADTEKEKIAGSKEQVEDEKKKACSKADDVKPEDDMKKAGEDEEDEEEKKKKAEKGEAGVTPEQEVAAGASAGNTTTPGAVTGTKQDVFVPQSSVSVSREQKGADVDMTKSPLWNEIEDSFKKQMRKLDDMQEALVKRQDAIAKSMEDRLTSVKADLEKFYKGSFYKAAGENVAPEGVKAQSVAKQIEEGKVRYSS